MGNSTLFRARAISAFVGITLVLLIFWCLALPAYADSLEAQQSGISQVTSSTAAPAKKPEKGTDAITWTKRHGYFYGWVSGKKAKGLTTSKGGTYLFDKKGRQLTGWQKVKGTYRFFKVANGAKGKMVKNRVVNGIKLDKTGKAVYGSKGKSELKLMTQATKWVQRLTKPAQSQRTKLKACFKRVWKKTTYTFTRKFHSYSGWHRAFAGDVLFHNRGTCEAYGAAFAYLANACGSKRCTIVCSGGHGWSEVNGAVYDPDWAFVGGWRYFDFPMSQSGVNGAPGYKSAHAYVVNIAPHKKPWDSAHKAKSKKSGKTGWSIKNGKRCYYLHGKKLKSCWKTIGGKRYYFGGSGVASTGAKKVKGTWYIFSSKGKLLEGKNTRLVKVGGSTYRVTKAGKAKPGWDGAKTHLYLTNGMRATGYRLVSGRLYCFTNAGIFQPDVSAKLQAVAKSNAPATDLVQLLGAAKHTYSASNSCFRLPGKPDLGGADRIRTYNYIKVSTFVADDGIEYLESLSAQ